MRAHLPPSDRSSDSDGCSGAGSDTGLLRHTVRAATAATAGTSSSEESNSTSRTHTSKVGTHSYCAPEQLAPFGSYSYPADMFPLGLMFMELLCRFSTGVYLCVCVMCATRDDRTAGQAAGYCACVHL